MNYLWEVMLELKKRGVEEKSIRFRMPRQFSAYMEVSAPYLNQREIEEGAVIEVNPYYRFYNIFKDFYRPDQTEFPTLREKLFHLVLHQLMQNDAVSGMTREEYHKKLLFRDMTENGFGIWATEVQTLFPGDQQEILLSGLLKQYEIGSSLDMFKDMMEALIPNNIVYHSNQNPYEVLIYIGQKKGKEIENKMDFLIKMFVELPYYVDIYYEYHFGIIGMEETMEMDEIILC